MHLVDCRSRRQPIFILPSQEVGHCTAQARDDEHPQAMADVGEVVELHRVGLGTSPHVPERYRVVAAAGYYAASTRFAGF